MAGDGTAGDGRQILLLVFNSVAQTWKNPLSITPLGSHHLPQSPLSPAQGHHHPPQPHALLSVKPALVFLHLDIYCPFLHFHRDTTNTSDWFCFDTWFFVLRSQLDPTMFGMGHP